MAPALPYILAIVRFIILRVAVNAIPIFGLAYGGWSGATALTVYWVENAVASLLVAIRIFLHEKLTHKRGHYRAQIGVTVTSSSNAGESEIKITSFFAEFLLSAVLFTLAHGFFLGAFLAIALKTAPDWETVQRASISIAGLQLLGFLVDLATIASRPFSWIKNQAGATLGRVVLLQLAIIFGAGIAALSGHDNLFYLPFAGLKLLADLAEALPKRKDPYSSPRWLSAIMRHIKPAKDLKDYKGWDDYIAKERVRDMSKDADDELIGPAKPGKSGASIWTK